MMMMVIYTDDGLVQNYEHDINQEESLSQKHPVNRQKSRPNDYEPLTGW